MLWQTDVQTRSNIKIQPLSPPSAGVRQHRSQLKYTNLQKLSEQTYTSDTHLHTHTVIIIADIPQLIDP